MAEFQTPVKKNYRNKDSNETIVIPPSPFLNRLGYGTGVSVMQLVRSPRAGQIRSPWALKMLNKHVKPNKMFTVRLKAEAEVLQRMSHPNIVGFRAFSKTEKLYLGMEACDMSLGDMIEKRAEDEIDPFAPKEILKVALDMGNALDYLHTKMQLLHGDMKSYNILINGDFVICKLCDFGVTLPLDKDGLLDKEKAGEAVYFGTGPWSSPEVVHDGQLSSATDIFPLGLVFWEMMALTVPHSDIDETQLTLDNDSFEDIMSEKYGTRPPVPGHIRPEVYSAPLALHYWCTEQSPAMRPSGARLALCAGPALAEAGPALAEAGPQRADRQI